QIDGEEIPSIKNEIYNIEVIQFFDFKVFDIKNSAFLTGLYQKLIKNPAVLRIYDENSEMYSFALKRLNQNDKNEIVVTDEFATDIFYLTMSNKKVEFEEIMDYENIVNKINKLNFYTEMYIKSYILKNENIHKDLKFFLKKPIWYDAEKMNGFYKILKELVNYREELKKISINSRKIEINKKIKETILKLKEYE
ncbi:MAG: DUF4391 domain-containing protein, partial [Pseudoleptotrichia goodfellowii]|nr:DUF4391 domain-containing protein [Pseudoleptotrichia goodfellowii]